MRLDLDRAESYCSVRDLSLCIAMSFKPLIFCIFLGASAGIAHADPGDAIGSTVAIVNSVTGAFRQDVRTLATGDDVVQEEVIAAGTDSIAEIMLRDQTKLALGPGSRLTLDRFDIKCGCGSTRHLPCPRGNGPDHCGEIMSLFRQAVPRFHLPNYHTLLQIFYNRRVWHRWIIMSAPRPRCPAKTLDTTWQF